MLKHKPCICQPSNEFRFTSFHCQVGKDWESVVEKCSRGRYQPLLLLYATPEPTVQPQHVQPTQVEQQMQSGVPPSSNMRRAITPSPEKHAMNSTRRAITPTPNRNIACGDYQNLSVIQNKIFGTQGPNIPNDAVHQQQYQNLSVIQNKIFGANGNGSAGDEIDGIGSIQQIQVARKQQLNLHRSLSAESTQNMPPILDGLSVPEHLNQPRRRDSGNWSGDRNSASSSSSTTLENSYMYLVGKRNGNGSHPPSPTRLTQNVGKSGQLYDAGYDSYSLSSTDSYPPKQHNPQLAKIPESVVLSGDCERLCMEADQLLEKSRITEEAHDLETALLLCNVAAGKARAAMDVPYSNPHTMTFARMKHNTCIMRARSLHRRLLIEKGGGNIDFGKEQYITTCDIRNPRDGGSGSLRHMRQNSKDGMSPSKNIEIYATLPKKGKSPLKLMENEDAIEQYIQSPPQAKPERESRTLSIFGRGKRNDDKEKRSRSEDRNKIAREFTVAGEPLLANAKDTLKKHKEDKDEKSEKEKSNKKQHKVRRKILMGGLIRRKNRSMPDLTEANAQEGEKETQPKVPTPIKVTVDDSSLGNSNTNNNSMSGYLSEGHFEYQTINGNPNLERSKLMRKNVQNGAAYRPQLTQVKVPPPPPLRTNSTLSQQQLQLHQQHMEQDVIKPYHQANASLISNMSSNTSMSEDSCQTIITTCAVVHQEQSPHQRQQTDQMNGRYSQQQSVDEVDSRFETNLDLPPYPSPPASSCHSRQASEDFPPPPPTVDLIEPASLDQSSKSLNTLEGTTSILAQLKQRQTMLQHQQRMRPENGIEPIQQHNAHTWLSELQAKQSALNKKGVDQGKQAAAVNDQKSVRDLASRFEQIKMPSGAIEQSMIQRSPSSHEILQQSVAKPQIRTGMNGLPDSINIGLGRTSSRDAAKSPSASSYDEVDCASPTMMAHKNLLSKSTSAPYLATMYGPPKQQPLMNVGMNGISDAVAPTQSQIAEEIREVEMLNAVVHQTLNNNAYAMKQFQQQQQQQHQDKAKKKSVSFCDQVILVATADEDEDDSFIPNPILERVLRTANYNGGDFVDPKAIQQQQNALRLQNEATGIVRQQIIPLNVSACGDIYRAEMSQQQQERQKQMILQRQQLANANAIMSPAMYGSSSPNQELVPEMQKALPLQANGNYLPPPTQMYQHVQGMQQRQPVVNGLEVNHHPQGNNIQPTPYMQVPQMHPNMAYMKGARPQNYPLQQHQPQLPAGYMVNGGSPNTPPSVYQMPPQIKYMQPNDQQLLQNGNGMYIQQQGLPNGQPNHQLPPQAQMGVYQKVPMPNGYGPPPNQDPTQMKIPAHQQYYPIIQAAPKATTKKVSFEPGTKGESDSISGDITPTAVNGTSAAKTEIGQTAPALTVTAIPTRVFNNSAIVKASAKAVQCNLCRKKHVIAPAIYCSDCEFYMSRFQPRV